MFSERTILPFFVSDSEFDAPVFDEVLAVAAAAITVPGDSGLFAIGGNQDRAHRHAEGRSGLLP